MTACFPPNPSRASCYTRRPAATSIARRWLCIDAEVRKQEKALRKAGFREAGDVMCEALEKIAFHIYLRADKSAIAWFRVSYPDEVVCEVFSLFPGGQLLLTSQDAMAADNRATGLHVQAMSGASPEELAAAHEKCLSELKGSFGAPREIPSGVKHLAEALAVSRGELLARVLEQLRQIVQEAACRDAVHDAVVVGERDREDSPHTPACGNRLVHHHPRRSPAYAKYGSLSGGERGRRPGHGAQHAVVAQGKSCALDVVFGHGPGLRSLLE